VTTATPSVPVRAGAPDAATEEEFFDALERADEVHAVDLVTRLLDAGGSAEDVLLRLVVPTQERVGELWRTGEWSVAQEHAATCINERVVAAVGARTRTRGRQGHVVVACLDGEWHALPARILGEVLRLHDWQVTFLGASVPPVHLVSFLHQQGPDVVALSAALPIHLPAAHRTIVAAQRTGTPVLVGGPGFGADGCWARRLGVDAWAATAADAVALLAGRPWPEPVRDRGSDVVGDAGSEAEYAGVRERRGRLIVAAVERLRRAAGGFGAVTPLSDSPLDDDLGQVADFLATAAYLRHRRLFTDHLGWLVDVSIRRGAPAAALPTVLDAFRGELHDFPFAQSCLDEGRAMLIDRAMSVDGAVPTAGTTSPGETP
jgi:methanogenic corrinoid protein MtbC1